MTPASADIYTDFTSFSRLRADARDGGTSAREETASQMEAMFVSLMLKSMREAGAALGNDVGAGMERDLYDSQLALNLARTGQLGFAQTVFRDAVPAASAGGEARAFPAPARNTAILARDWVAIRSSRIDGAQSQAASTPPVRALTPTQPAARSVAPGPQDWSTPEAFARSLWPAASQAARELGTRPEAVLAVAALETGWGRHLPRREDGSSSNNLFGIKAHGWKGEVTRSPTLEFEGGAFKRRVEPFRAYESPEAAVADFANFVRSNPRYNKVLSSGGDPVTFVRALHKAGYATDPRYAEKLEALVKSVPLKSAAAAADTSSV